MSVAKRVIQAIQTHLEDSTNWNIASPPSSDMIRCIYDANRPRNPRTITGVYIKPGKTRVEEWFAGEERYMHQYLEIWVKGYDSEQRDEWAGDIRDILGGLIIPGYSGISLKAINQFEDDLDGDLRWGCSMEYMMRFVE